MICFHKVLRVSSKDVLLRTVFCSTTVVLEKRSFHISSGSINIFCKFRLKLILTAEVPFIKKNNPNGKTLQNYFVKKFKEKKELAWYYSQLEEEQLLMLFSRVFNKILQFTCLTPTTFSSHICLKFQKNGDAHFSHISVCDQLGV